MVGIIERARQASSLSQTPLRLAEKSLSLLALILYISTLSQELSHGQASKATQAGQLV